MKRVFPLLLVLVLMLCMCGCNTLLCKHRFEEATCQAPKTCTLCGKTDGEALGHTFTDATCTSPKTCSVCNATEGEALGHKYEIGSCTVCGGTQPDYHAFTDGRWRLAGITAGSNEEHEELDIIYLDPSGKSGPFVSVGFYENFSLLDEEYQQWYMTEGSGDLYEFNGQKYSSMGFGTGADLSFTVNGDTVVAEITQGSTGTLVLQRVSGNQFRVASKNGIIVDEIVDTVVTVGSIFTYDG